MIWEQRPAAIVMVTNTIENRKVKCMQYWPLEQGVIQSFGSFKVSLKSTDMFSEFAMNRLEVTQNGETRQILHFYYLSWPDHGVPDIELFVSFHRLIKASIHLGRTQPLLVHCSAGVGRTGTYVALDYLLDQAKAEGVVDVFECLKEMRSRRPCMIQTVDQYELLHDALSEALATQNFPCQSTEVEFKISMHKLQPNSEADLISVEYQKGIASYTHMHVLISTDLVKMVIATFVILLAESAMPYLINGVNGNYINAVIVDGYKKKKRWIATQLPLSNTIADFWQLILENDISVIFQLDTSPSKISVQVLVMDASLVEDLPDTNHILSLLKTSERQEKGVALRRMDGSSKCGIYICAYNAIEKLKTEQMVDVYTPTVIAKLRRPQFISTIEQYEYLFQVLNDYLCAFGEYANFG
ncbi:receptor-type tyrosine-protein phosphatase T-like [Watersipora subatra]|uniref:receptor-type tyrosine-protein phosphatase T-like n=1 Tax=Watersipora subatra TaxID=2589382 RepID=UPI00355C2BBA